MVTYLVFSSRYEVENAFTLATFSDQVLVASYFTSSTFICLTKFLTEGAIDPLTSVVDTLILYYNILFFKRLRIKKY